VVTIRLIDDGYIVYEGGSVEIGLLKDYGGWAYVRAFEDGTVYVYNANVGGNGVFNYVAASADVNRYVAAVATAISASTVLTASVGRGLWSIPSPV